MSINKIYQFYQNSDALKYWWIVIRTDIILYRNVDVLKYEYMDMNIAIDINIRYFDIFYAYFAVATY